MKKSNYDEICAHYERNRSINATRKELGVDMGQIRKCIITAGMYKSFTYHAIIALKKYGASKKDILEELHISDSAYCNNTPYIRFDPEEPTKNALKVRDCRERKKRMNKIRRKKLEQASDLLYEALQCRADVQKATDLAEKAKNIIDDMRDEEQDAFDNLPDGFQTGDRGQQMEENIMNMDSAVCEIDDLDFTKEQRLIEEDIFTIIGYIDL